ncbi:MAG: protein-L-isoaspartate O-methyltransferase [Devosiaceae bacterium]|nr:protein-L-isoaspartate O-methyltransferase [Devosiaceae bacterium MH13]
MNMAERRTKMVDNQLRPFDVSQYAVLSTFLQVPRDLFVPENKRALAYSDAEIEVADGDNLRRMIRPMHLARMVQAANLTPDSVVLDVGCLTGYSSAVLAQLAGSVVALEQSEAMVARATDALSDATVDTVAVVQGALNEGYASEGPFDAIIAAGAMEEVPQALVDQLREDGVLITAVGTGGAGRAVSIRKDGSTYTSIPLFNCAAPALPGFEKAPAFAF